MYPIRLSASDDDNALFKARKRDPKETNLDWFERARAELPDSKGCAILLIGGCDVAHFRLRVAQSVARNDLTPSHWSHVALITHCHRSWKAGTALSEISLAPRNGFGWPPERNALIKGRLGDYSKVALFPNVALISVPCEPSDVEEQLESFARKPLEVDAVSMLVKWLSYLWGACDERNPLEHSIGMPGAVLIDSVVSSAWRDLTPGLASTASCPEAIWQSVKHWSHYYASTAPAMGSAAEESEVIRTLSGSYHTENRLVPEEKKGGGVLYCGR